VSRQDASSPFIKLKIFAYAHSQIARLLLTKNYLALDFTRKSCQDFTTQYIDLQGSRLSNHLKRSEWRSADARNAIFQVSRIKRLADEASIPLVIVLIPDETQINGDLQKRLFTGESHDHDLDMPQSMLQALCRDRGIPSIVLLPYFREDPRCLYMNDTHWTPEGHALAAAAICDGLVPFLKVHRRPGS
jgi:SGNH hydrolase-like domain, acetyltransferase AlgX